MAKTILIIILAVFSTAFLGTVVSSTEWGEWDDDDHHYERYRSDDYRSGYLPGGWFESREDVRPVESQEYRDECGSCHFAFQPGLLPQNAWMMIMDRLGDHYGDDASLDKAQASKIRNYLLMKAADNAAYSRSRAFAAGTSTTSTLPRITETAYFLREHYEIPRRLVTGNPQVRSFSNCQSCHSNADLGIYNEHQVMIPGVGRWDD